MYSCIEFIYLQHLPNGSLPVLKSASSSIMQGLSKFGTRTTCTAVMRFLQLHLALLHRGRGVVVVRRLARLDGS
jgi:hypothetical protein